MKREKKKRKKEHFAFLLATLKMCKVFILPSVQICLFFEEWLIVSGFIQFSSALCNKIERDFFLQNILPRMHLMSLTNVVRVNFDSVYKMFTNGFRFEYKTGSSVLISFSCILDTKYGQKLLLENAHDISITLGSIRCQSILLHGKNLRSLSFYTEKQAVDLYPNFYHEKNFRQSWPGLCGSLSKSTHKYLTAISFCGIDDVNDKTIRGLVKHFKSQLLSLNLHACFSLTDFSVTHVVKLCVLLKELDIGAIPSLTDESINCLTDHAVSINKLVLGCRASNLIMPYSIAAIVALIKKRGHAFISLDLENIAESSIIRCLSEYCPDVSDLNIRNCQVYSIVDDIRRLSTSCRNIMTLNVKGKASSMPVEFHFILVRDLHLLCDYSFTPFNHCFKNGEYEYMICLLAFKFKTISVCDMVEARFVGTLYSPDTDLSSKSFRIVSDCNLNGTLNLDMKNSSMDLLSMKCGSYCLKVLSWDASMEKHYGSTMLGNFIHLDIIKRLETLCLENMETLADTHLSNQVSLMCNRLKHFHVLGCNNITSKGVVDVCLSNPGLLSVSLGAGLADCVGVSKLDDLALLDGICTLKNISSLILYNIKDITSGAMDEVVKNCKYLEEVYMRRCPNCEFDDVYKCLSRCNTINCLKVNN